MKAKIYWALASIACVLLLSSIISIVEYNRVSSSVSGHISADVAALKIVKGLAVRTEEFNLKVLNSIGAGDFKVADCLDGQRDSLVNIRNSVHELSKVPRTDSLLLSFDAYVNCSPFAGGLKPMAYDDLIDWYFMEFQPLYKKFQHETFLVEDELHMKLKLHSESFQDAFYRSIVPGMVAVCSGLVLVLLLGYYFMSYYVNPIYKMLNGIEAYKKFGRSYTYDFEGDDQLAELNAELTDIVEENITYKKRLRSYKDNLQK